MITKENKDKAFAVTQLHKNDVGSAQAQISVLTARIAEITNHMKSNKHDFAGKEIKEQAQKEKEYLFYITPRYVIRKETVKADYFDVQDYGCDDTYVVAAFPDYDSAVKYCNKENISINNIVPQKWGHHESLD